MRAAIKAGDFPQFGKLFSSDAADIQKLLAMASQNYNTAGKHDGHAKIVDFLLQQGAKPQLGMLIEAARDGSRLVVERLLAGGLDLDVFAGSLTGNVALVKRHLRRDPQQAQSRVPADAEKYRGCTPLHCCCLSGLARESAEQESHFLEVGKLLVASDADVNATGTLYGYFVTPLDVLAHTGGILDLSHFLISQGATISCFAFIEALSHRGRSLADGLALANQFLESGYDINTADNGRSALHAMSKSGGTDVVKWLLQNGADVNVRGQTGRTPLHVAAERNSTSKIVELLVAAGADTKAKDDRGRTALQIAEEHGKTAVAGWLRNAR